MRWVAIIPGLGHLVQGRLVDALITAFLVTVFYLIWWPLGFLMHAFSIQDAMDG